MGNLQELNARSLSFSMAIMCHVEAYVVSKNEENGSNVSKQRPTKMLRKQKLSQEEHSRNVSIPRELEFRRLLSSAEAEQVQGSDLSDSQLLLQLVKPQIGAKPLSLATPIAAGWQRKSLLPALLSALHAIQHPVSATNGELSSD